MESISIRALRAESGELAETAFASSSAALNLERPPPPSEVPEPCRQETATTMTQNAMQRAAGYAKGCDRVTLQVIGHKICQEAYNESMTSQLSARDVYT
jgi:hypothetical protein